MLKNRDRVDGTLMEQNQLSAPVVAGAPGAAAGEPPTVSAAAKIDTAVRHLYIVSSAALGLMTPGLAFFYGEDCATGVSFKGE
ncbi:hypothetical protein [Coleofasciculus sp. FACHB-SPT9]|uniref:hypothetical protein n=1 Tax=Cyanophyceae TaxID=3028117 RepID=UPI0016855D54|nr:hypothetical protein [Coleofasciculus sp. FACHB-SPT9]MBD1892300.1 hypothetical protein [Coleofasciculus sp. FACHB-SPT9]